MAPLDDLSPEVGRKTDPVSLRSWSVQREDDHDDVSNPRQVNARKLGQLGDVDCVVCWSPLFCYSRKPGVRQIMIGPIGKRIRDACSWFLADRTATQYDRLLASSCCASVRLSVCLSVTLCIVALRVGVHG